MKRCGGCGRHRAVELPVRGHHPGSLGQALATGNTVVLKRAPDTPFNATRLGRLIAQRTDIPAGVVNVVTASDHLVGEQLTVSPKVDLISFTGSTAVGCHSPDQLRCTSSGPPSSPWLLVCMVRWLRGSPRPRTGCAVARLEAARDPHHRAAGILSSADLVEHTDHVLDVNVVRDVRKMLRFQ